jgi:hypothetical protein
MMEKALGPNPQLYPPVVEAYEWAGQRGDELVIVYRVWGGHPRRHETRWAAICWTWSYRRGRIRGVGRGA